MSQSLIYAAWWRRIGSLLYEALLVAAILLAAGFVFQPVFIWRDNPFTHWLFQLYLLGILLGYFYWFWRHGGQTLAMKTWRLRIVNTAGQPISATQALLRFFFAWLGIFCAGISLWWAWFDRDGQYLHDRLLKTRLIKV